MKEKPYTIYDFEQELAEIIREIEEHKSKSESNKEKVRIANPAFTDDFGLLLGEGAYKEDIPKESYEIY